MNWKKSSLVFFVLLGLSNTDAVSSQSLDRKLLTTQLFANKENSRGSGQPKGTPPFGSNPACPEVNPPLTALATVTKQPNDLELRWGSTIQTHPTFWVYVPYEAKQIISAQFVMRNRVGDEAGKILYETPIKLVGTPGVVVLSLPQTELSLEVGKWYEMQLALTVSCNLAASPLSETMEAWVVREKIDPSLSNRLANKTPQQQATLYAENGFLYDALLSLTESKCKNSNDGSWYTLLKKFNLEAISTKPIVDHRTFKKCK